MLRRAAFAARVVASMPIVLPLIRSAVASTCRTPVKTVRGVSTSINRRVREIVECSGGVSSRPRPRKPAQGERIRRPPCYATFRVDAFEVPAQQQPEVRAWRQTRPAHGLRIERGALGFDEFVERVRVEHLIQPQVERVPAGSGQFIGSNPQSRRPCAILASTHRHAGSVVRQIDRVDSLLATGC